MKTTAIRAFHRLCLSTLVAVYFLILVGGVVRTTGSGMGCPDWPTCFGRLVPPTSVDQLPADYQQTYSSYRDKKNQKFIKYLRAFGFSETATRLANDPGVKEEAVFNPVKTWTEYVNRLVGVTIGLFIIALFLKSWKVRTNDPRIFWLSLFTLILVIFQGWFGSIVVSTNLTTWTITVHMMLALLMVAVIVYLYQISGEKTIPQTAPLTQWVLAACIGLLFIQIILGTQVRESVDLLVSAGIARISWMERLGREFIIHRSFSWLLLFSHLALLGVVNKTKGNRALTQALFVLILGTLLTGVAMAYAGVPAFIQPIHLLIATVTFGMQLLMWFQLGTRGDSKVI